MRQKKIAILDLLIHYPALGTLSPYPLIVCYLIIMGTIYKCRAGIDWLIFLPGYIEQVIDGPASCKPKVKRGPKPYSIPLPDNWATIRAQVIERDKVCQDCGGKGHGVHHIDQDRTHNTLGNLVYLCWPCHSGRHHTLMRCNRHANAIGAHA